MVKMEGQRESPEDSYISMTELVEMRGIHIDT